MHDQLDGLNGNEAFVEGHSAIRTNIFEPVTPRNYAGDVARRIVPELNADLVGRVQKVTFDSLLRLAPDFFFVL